MPNRRHNHLLTRRLACLMSEKVKAVVIQKHVRKVKRRKRNRRAMKNITKINFTSVSLELVPFPMEEQQHVINIRSDV